MKTVVELHGEICDGLKELYKKKNADYGDSFAAARKEVPYYTLGRIYDKFNRYKTLTLNGEKNLVADETVVDTLRDMANYCLMEVAERMHEKEQEEEDSICNAENKIDARASMPVFDKGRTFSATLTSPVKFIGENGDTVMEFIATGMSTDYGDDGSETAPDYKMLYENVVCLTNSENKPGHAKLTLEREYAKYCLTLSVGQDDYDDDTFIVKCMQKLRDDFAEYVVEHANFNETYVVRWDDVINPYSISSHNLVEVYEKFNFAVESLARYYAE